MSGSTNRIVYIEPNDFLGGKTRYGNDLYDTNTIQTNAGAVGDNVTLLNEDLTMSVDLQVVIPDRGGIVNEGKTTILFNSYNENTDGDRYISLMSGKPITVNGVENTFNELTTDYTVASYHELRSNGQGDTESLCIKDISIKFDSHFYPRVTMTMVDVRGYALMMPTEDVYREYISEQMNITPETKTKSSFFRSLFRLPYPRFILTIKGYYGKPVTFNLTVSSFKSAFDSVTGDFNIIIDFIGNVYGLYSDIPFNLLVIAPYIGVASKSIDITDKNTLLRNYGPFWENMSTNGSLYYCGEDRNKRILTFTEYLRSMTNLKEMDHTNAESRSDEDNVKFYTDVKSAISEIIKLYNELYDRDNFYKVFSDGVKTSFFTRNGYLGIAVFLKDDENKEYIGVSDNYQTVKELKAKIKECNAKFGKDKRINDIINEVRKIYSNFSELFPLASFLNDGKLNISYNDPLGFKECNTYEEWKQKNADRGYSENFNEVFESRLNRNKYGLVETVDMPMDMLTEVLNSLTQKISNFNNNRNQRFNSNMLNFLGFKPNIRNMFRMVFAHMSAFTDSFYNLLYTIKANSSKRMIRNLVTNSTGSVKMENTDIINYDEGDALAPFPLIYDEDENGIQVIQYPGNSKIDMLRDLDEVKYIEDIIKSIHMSKAEIDAALYDSVYASEIAFAGQLRALEERLRRDMANIRPVIQNFNYHYNNYGGGGGGRGEVASNPSNVSTFPFIPQDVFVTGNNYGEGWITSNKDATKLFIHRIIIWIKSHYFIDSSSTNKLSYDGTHFEIQSGKVILKDKGKEILWEEFRRMREGTFTEIDFDGIEKTRFNFGNKNACFFKYYVNKSIPQENYQAASGYFVNSDDGVIGYYDGIKKRNYTYTTIFKADGNGAYGNFGGSALKKSLGRAFFNGVVMPTKKGENIDSKVRAIFYKSFPKYTYYPIRDLMDFYNRNKDKFAGGNKNNGYCFSYSGVATIGDGILTQLAYNGADREKVRPRFYDFTLKDNQGNNKPNDVFNEMRKFYTSGQFDNKTYIAPCRNLNSSYDSVHVTLKKLFSEQVDWITLKNYYYDNAYQSDPELENFLAGGKSGVLLFTLPQLCYWCNCYYKFTQSSNDVKKGETYRRLNYLIAEISKQPFAKKWLDAAINKTPYETWSKKYDVETKGYFGIEGLKELNDISKNDGNKERHELLSTMFAIVIMPRTKSSTVLDLSNVYEFMKKDLKTNASLN